MTKEMTFNGVDMSRFFRITEIIRPIGNKRFVSTDSAPLLGVNIQQVKRGEKEHTIKFDLKTTNAMEMEQLKHELAGVLDVVEPVKITYGDEPDKYYMGMPVDDITPDNLTRWFQRSEMKILIPDGVAHSSTYREFDSDDDANITSDEMVFDLDNTGTVPAFPIITIKHNSENGYIGLLNTQGIMELGSKQEMDKVSVKPSEFLLDFRSDITSGLNSGKKNVAVLNDNLQRLNGRVQVKNEFGKNQVYLADRGGYVESNAGSLTWDIPKDSYQGVGVLNEALSWQQTFMAGYFNEYGVIKLSVSDESGQFLYGVETFKRTFGMDCEYNFMTSDGKGWYNTIRKWKFQGGEYNTNNLFGKNGGTLELKRNDDKVTVYWNGSYYEIYVPEIKGKKSAKVHLSFGTYGRAPLVKHMYVNSLYYRKDFTGINQDVPNRYPMGTQVVLNSEEDTVYVDGIKKISDVVDGSTFLKIPPGKSKLKINFSSWIQNKPKVTVEFEERWL